MPRHATLPLTTSIADQLWFYWEARKRGKQGANPEGVDSTIIKRNAPNLPLVSATLKPTYCFSSCQGVRDVIDAIFRCDAIYVCLFCCRDTRYARLPLPFPKMG